MLDITMTRLGGIDAARQIRLSNPATRLVFPTIREDPEIARAAFDAGALGYVVKSRLAPDLLPCVHAAIAGRRFLSPCVNSDAAA